MKWIMRLVVYGTALTTVCRHLSHEYQEWLAISTSGIMRLIGQPVTLTSLEIYAPVDVGIFVAMCMASNKAPRRVRLRALMVGMPLMAILELCTVLLALGVTLAGPTQSLGGTLAYGLARYAPETLIWIVPVFLWLALLGSWEVPLGRSHK